MSKEVIAILCSDLHFSDKAPSIRHPSVDWYEVMEFYIRQLNGLSFTTGDAPIIVAGDVFHKWNSPPRLINFLMDELPHLYAIPGQHDLPHHNTMKIGDSAFYTLFVGKVISWLDSEQTIPTPQTEIDICTFHWEAKEHPPFCTDYPTLAVLHRYIWTDPSNCYPGAPEQAKITNMPFLKKFDAAVFGDNHRGFITKYKKTNVINCGCFIRRRSDEINYEPQVGLLLDDMTIVSHKLDTSIDKFSDITPEEEYQIEADELLEELREMEGTAEDFESILRSYAAQAHPQVGEIILEALEDQSAG